MKDHLLTLAVQYWKNFVNWKTWDSTEYTILKKSNVLLDLLKKKMKRTWNIHLLVFLLFFFIRRRTPSNRKWVSNTLLSGNDSWNMKHGREGMTQRTGGTAQSRPGTRRLLTVPFWNPLGRLGFHNYTVIPYCGISELSTASNASAWRKAEASRTVLHFNELYIYTTEYTYFAFCTLRHILSLSCFSPIEQWLHKSRSAYGAACHMTALPVNHSRDRSALWSLQPDWMQAILHFRSLRLQLSSSLSLKPLNKTL